LTELTWWLTNAFNGEWLRIENVVPKAQSESRAMKVNRELVHPVVDLGGKKLHHG
jgi:hypothetical protein